MFTKEFLQQIEAPFQARLERIGGKRAEVEAVLAQCTADEAEAFKYIYAAMPTSDAADYEPELFLKYARHSVFLWYEGPFAGKVPEEIFAPYVLFHRLSGEELTDCRPFFYNMLKDKIVGLNMNDAAIEVNYWCASEVTYQSTDGRTASPESLYRSGYGRCGEESVFGAAVFRSLGIPARQVYTPAWAHCNDNHAWVEVWCDGEWKFLGACEPEPVLNKGWFSSPSSRAMLILATCHSPIPPKGSILGRGGSVHVINQLSTYAETTNFTVTVVDENGNPMPDVMVTFSIFNYGMFSSMASVRTNERGEACLETGFGTMMVSIHEKDVTTELFVNTIKQNSCTLVAGTLNETLNEWEEFTTIAPVATSKNFIHMSAEAAAKSEARLAEVTQMRLNKVAAFYDEDLAEKSIEGYSEEEKVRCREIMKMACGNQREIAKFLAKDPEGKYPAEWKLEILNSLREKDYVDATCEWLEEHCEMTAPYADWYENDILYKYVLCPRIFFEPLRSFRKFIMSWLTEEQKDEFRKNPSAVCKMLDEMLHLGENFERGRVVVSIQGAVATGYGNPMSAKLMTVQILRTLGIPAMFNFRDGVLEAWKNGEFVPIEDKKDDVDFSAGRTGEIRIHETEGVEWQYHENWMIARFENGGYRPIHLPWRKEDFDGTLKVFPGKFRVMTSNRLPNGNCFLKQLVFEVKDGEKKDIYLEQKQMTLADMLEKNQVSDFALTREDGTRCQASELVKNQKGLFIWLQESKEPTEHVLNEMYDVSESFENLTAGKVYFIIRNKAVKEDPTLKRTLTKLSKVEFLYDDFGEDMERIAVQIHKDPGELPLIAVLDESLTALYGVAGYSVGTANMMLKVLNAAK